MRVSARMVTRARGISRERLLLLGLLRRADPASLGALLTLTVVAVGAPVVLSVMTARVVDDLARRGDLSAVVGSAIGLAVAIVALQFAMSMKDALSDRVRLSIDGSIRSRVRRIPPCGCRATIKPPIVLPHKTNLPNFRTRLSGLVGR